MAAELTLVTTSLKVLNISSDAVAQLVGDNGSNIDKVREATGAEVEMEEQNTREEEEQTTTLKITLKGSGEAVRNAFRMVELLLKRHNLLIGEVVDRVLAPERNSSPKQIVREAIEKRQKVHPSGKILFFDGAVPWKKPFFALEKELGLGPAGICLVIYRANTDGNWRVEAMPKGKGNEANRRILLPWKGLRDAELEEQSGICGAYFVKSSGFVGGARTVEAAMRMAEQTLILNGDPTASAPPSLPLPKCTPPTVPYSGKSQGDDAAKRIVREAIEKRAKVHPSGKILFLDGAVPWEKNFFKLEKELGLGPDGICLAVFKVNTDGNWRVEAIPKAKKWKANTRILLPWKGLQDAELEQESGIQGAYFVKPSGFTGGAKTVEAAMRMAEQTLKLNG